MKRWTTVGRLTGTVAVAVGVTIVPAISSAGASSAGAQAAATTTTTAPREEPAGSFCSSIPPDGEGSFVGMADDPVATAAANNPYLTTLASALEAAGLVDTLNGEGPFTVFAPSNEAFANLPEANLDAILADIDLLTMILTYHVAAGQSLSAAELVAAGSVPSVLGRELTFAADDDGTLRINGGVATVTCANIATANATVHVIDSVLLPMGGLIEVR